MNSPDATNSRENLTIRARPPKMPPGCGRTVSGRLRGYREGAVREGLTRHAWWAYRSPDSAMAGQLPS